MKLFAYFHWDGREFQYRGTLKAEDDLAAFEVACQKLKLLHRGNIAVKQLKTSIQ